MGTITVGELAKVVGAPTDRLLKQMHEAGLKQKQPSDKITDFDKQVLLSHLKGIHYSKDSEPKIRLKRKKTFTVNSKKTGENNIYDLNSYQEKEQQKIPKVFISYSWDSESHKSWVEKIAKMLRSDGVDAILDQWHLHPGDPITHFMEKSIKESDFVLIICTEEYKTKSDSKVGGVGYEDSIISNDMFTNSNHRKYLPIVKTGKYQEAIPTSLHSKMFIDFSSDETFGNSYRDLLLTLFGQRKKAPPLGKAPSFL